MLVHLVAWRYRDDVPEVDRAAHVAALRALAGVVPGLRSLRAGADVLRLDRSYHTGLVATFDDRAALAAYDAHSRHREAVGLGLALAAHVVSVDFEEEFEMGAEG